MSNLKDTDIDDLFRRASDKYPLRTDSADWDRMAAALDKEPPLPPDAVDADEKRRKRRFFLLFLLLPLAGAGYYVWHQAGHGNGATNVIASQPKTTQGSTARSNTGDATGRNNEATAGDEATVGNNATSGNGGTSGNNATSGIRSTVPSSVASGGRPDAGAHSDNDHRFAAASHSVNGNGASKTHTKNTNPEGPGLTEETKPDHSLSLTAADTRRQPGGENGMRTRGGENGTPIPGGENSALVLGSKPSDRLFYDLQRALISRDYQLQVDVKAPAAKKDTTKPKAKSTTKHFYASLVGAPDLSTVKMQSVKGVGSTFGLLLGYTFNGGHWAIETGAFVDRKKYYTDGEYFSKEGLQLPPSYDLLNVNGVCYMWEIPLNVRYNFNPGAKTSWFATAGFSTYLMNREKYIYDWKWYNGTTVWPVNIDLKKSSQYPFSIINLSAGFEQRLGKIGSLRIEPYVRLPLTGLGTGKLSIMSTGVNIGITRQLW